MCLCVCVRCRLLTWEATAPKSTSGRILKRMVLPLWVALTVTVLTGCGGDRESTFEMLDSAGKQLPMGGDCGGIATACTEAGMHGSPKTGAWKGGEEA